MSCFCDSKVERWRSLVWFGVWLCGASSFFPDVKMGPDDERRNENETFFFEKKNDPLRVFFPFFFFPYMICDK